MVALATVNERLPMDKWYCARWDIRTGSGLVYKGPARIMTVHCQDPSANSKIVVGDGVNSNATAKGQCGALQHETGSLRFRRGVLVDSGIYITSTQTTTVTTVEYEPIDRHENVT
jgi:hypothetical protein